ncbi:MAG: hypothetical protein L0Z07_08140 [Planctomycetes bacterium]|nr:hypothetical protein [Planctomycetota bacterium]
MIDDPAQVTSLMQKMESHLPIPAQATNALARTLRASAANISSKRRMQIEAVLYLGDEGGIGCDLKIPGQASDTAMVVSLTHLRLSSTHPVAPDVRAYQIARTKKLARGH